MRGDIDIINELIQFKADVNKQDISLKIFLLIGFLFIIFMMFFY